MRKALGNVIGRLWIQNRIMPVWKKRHKQSYFPMTNHFPGSILKLIIVFREVFIMYIASKERYTTMEYNRCGDSGLMLPKVSLGLWHNFGDTSKLDNMRQLCFTAFDN